MTDAWPLYHYRGTVVRCVDADTVELALDLGLRISHTMHLRLAGINAPELNGADRPAALDALAFLSRMVSDRTVYVRTHKDGRSFSRYVGDLSIEGEAGALIDVAEALVAGGHAVRVAP